MSKLINALFEGIIMRSAIHRQLRRRAIVQAKQIEVLQFGAAEVHEILMLHNEEIAKLQDFVYDEDEFVNFGSPERGGLN